MGKQLSFFVEGDLLKITDNEIAQKQIKQKELKTDRISTLPNPFVEANKKFFGVESGEQIELNFFNSPIAEEEESMNFKEIAMKLEECRKYTLLMFDDVTGYPVTLHVTMKRAEVKPYAQYPEAIYLDYRAKRCRTDRQYVLMPDKSFVIWEGHIQVDTKMWGPGKQGSSPNVEVRRAKYGRHDKRFLTLGVESATHEPCVDYRPDYAIA